MSRLTLDMTMTALLLATPALLQVHHSTEEAGVERLRIHWPAGDVSIQASRRDTVAATSLAWGPESPGALKVTRDHEIMTMELRCRTPLPCSGDLSLEVPRGVQVELDLAQGHAMVDGQVGDLTVLVGTGRITADSLGETSAVLQVVHGDVRASWDMAPTRVVTAAVKGDVSLHLPEADYHLEEVTGQSEMVNLVHQPDSDRQIRVTTLAGQARIVGTGAVADLSDDGGLARLEEGP